MAHQTTIVTRTQRDSSAGSPFPSAFVKLKKASCPIPVHYRSATRRGEETKFRSNGAIARCGISKTDSNASHTDCGILTRLELHIWAGYRVRFFAA